MNMPFEGAKLALYLGSHLAVIQRDDDPDILYPGLWDLPGGGREGAESPMACALRETREELGLTVPEHAIHWGRGFVDGPARRWFFVARLPVDRVSKVVLGDEGQQWALMSPSEFLGRADAVPVLQDRLRVYLGTV